MANQYTDTMDRTVRASTKCPGCGKPKQVGCVVCWPCFKYRDNPLKYFANDTPDAGDLVAWLKAIGRPSLEEQGIVEPVPTG
ncbi:MAG: hypothetical protein ABIP48_18060 [Planctomycetota bacterium]